MQGGKAATQCNFAKAHSIGGPLTHRCQQLHGITQLLMLFQQAEKFSVYVGYWIHHSLAGSRSAMLIPTSMHQNDQVFQVS